MAEYLLAEVLERRSEAARRLLRTSMLEQVNGEFADLLTGGTGSERILQDLEQADAFVVSLDARRSWFRYHQMFTDLLELELRHTAPGEVTWLHAAAAGWFAGHGYPVEAIRHAQAARDWDLAARLLSDHGVSLALDTTFRPTPLAPEIASELSLLVNTVRTHMRHIYEKLGAHGRTEAVEPARALGLLAPSSRQRGISSHPGWSRRRGRTGRAFRAEEFEGRVEVVSNWAFDLDDFNRPGG